MRALPSPRRIADFILNRSYFLDNFKFLLSYPGRGAFYVFCGSLALANTGRTPKHNLNRNAATIHCNSAVGVLLSSLMLSQENPSPSSSADCSFYAESQSFIFHRPGTSPAPFFAPTASETSLRRTSVFLSASLRVPCVDNICRYGVTDQNSNTRYSAVPQVRFIAARLLQLTRAQDDRPAAIGTNAAV